MSAGLPVSEECQTFLCLICFENQHRDSRLLLKGCKVESHGCCLECAASFFSSRIEQGRVFELCCPVGAAEGGCRTGSSSGSRGDAALASREEVEKCLSGDTAMLEKYNRFMKTKVDSSLRDCPDCQELCKPELDEDGHPKPMMTCNACGSDFCYYHAAAHRGGSCEEYEVRLAAETKGISEVWGTKDCPKCARQTMKGGGCNHMTCQVCRCDWCWICGQPLWIRGPHGEDPIYWHYSDENITSGCQQFAEPGSHPDVETVRLWRRDRLPSPCMRRLTSPVSACTVALMAMCTTLAMIMWLVIYFVASFFTCSALLCLRCAFASRGSKMPEEWQAHRSQRLVKPTLYVAVSMGLLIFFPLFLFLCLIWQTLSLLIWSTLFSLSHLPGTRRCTPLTTRHHLRFFLSAPMRAVHQAGSSFLARLADRSREVARNQAETDATTETVA